MQSFNGQYISVQRTKLPQLQLDTHLSLGPPHEELPIFTLERQTVEESNISGNPQDY